MSQGPSDKIGVTTAAIVGMNAMIGAGIFALPTLLAGAVGPAGILSVAFVAGAVWCMAQSFARMAQLYPQEGSFYTYARQWGGHTAGLMASGAYLVGLLIAMGLLAHCAGEHFNVSLPFYTSATWGIITLATLTLLNMLGVSLSEIGQQILIILTVAPLLATSIMCFTKMQISNLVPFAPHGVSSIFDATRIAAFGFFGFEASASLFSVIKDPEKNLPKAITLSVIAVSALYLLFVSALILAVPLEIFSQNNGPISSSLQEIFPHQQWILTGIHVASLSAILGTLHSMIWSSGAMLLSFLKKLRNRTTQKLLANGVINNSTAVLLIGIAIYISFITLTNKMFFNLTALCLLFAFTCATIPLILRKQEWQSGQNYITIAGFLTAGIIAYFALTDLFAGF